MLCQALRYPFAAAAALSAGGLLLAPLTVGADQKPHGALDPQEFKPFKLLEKEKLTQNTYRFRFELPDNQTSGLTVASCLVTRALIPEEGAPADAPPKVVVRPYTPTSPPDARGFMDLVVKVYPTGKMSKHIGSLQLGDTLDMKGPIPKYPYTPNLKKKIGMVAGGTGITPMLQVIDAVLSNPADTTEISLVYASVSPRDIILKDKLDALVAKHPQRFKVHYVVDRRGWRNPFWRGGVGYITKDMLRAHLPEPARGTLVMVCGPPGLMESVSGSKAKDFTQGELKGLLKDIGYTPQQVFKF